MVSATISDTQMPSYLRGVCDEQLALYNKPRTVQNVNHIPDTTRIPITNQSHWLKIPDVVAIFVDMKGSTQLSATTHDKGTPGVYQLFTGTAVRLFDELDAPYIDVRGDGVLALYDQDQVSRAIAAAVTFKTFAEEIFASTIQEKTGLRVGAHIGIDQGTVLVRKIGLKRHADRSDRQNEVWAGKPVNMAAKLSAMADAGELIVSDRYFARIDHHLVTHSCGCKAGVPDQERVRLWTEFDVSDDPKFDFDTAYRLGSHWCRRCGEVFCNAILALDDE